MHAFACGVSRPEALVIAPPQHAEDNRLIFSIVDVVCATTSEAVASKLETELRDFADLPSEFFAAPPWAPPGPKDGADAARLSLARQTFLRVERARIVHDPPGFERAVQSARKGGAVDERVIELHREWLFGQPHDDATRFRRAAALGALMGQSPIEWDAGRPALAPAAGRYQTLVWRSAIERHGAALRLGTVSFTEPSSGQPPSFGYLCANGCTRLDYRIDDFVGIID